MNEFVKGFPHCFPRNSPFWYGVNNV